ncbi:MAG: helix-turn-helix domain-containing protein [Phycisphaerales bacterium]
MNERERRRLEMFSQVKAGRVSVAEAGRRLGISERQARRLWRRYLEAGDGGLVHGLRGRAGNAGKGRLRARALALYAERYRGLGVAHAAELLALEQQVSVSRQTLWRWLSEAGGVVRRRKVSRHRIRRPRKSCVGELVQMDGSTHAWFGSACGPCVLFVMIDDAGSRVFARFYTSEDTASAFDLFGRYIRRYGLPAALYVDRDSIYRVNDEPAREHANQAGKRPPLTQFGRAMDELGVTLFFARSPQAKGRPRK